MRISKASQEELRTMCEAVDEMAAAMKAKLRRKAQQGYHGGLQSEFAAAVRLRLERHMVRLLGSNYMPPKPDPLQAIDVANLAMMLWAQAGKPL